MRFQIAGVTGLHHWPNFLSFGSDEGGSQQVLDYIKNYMEELFSKALQANFLRVSLPKDTPSKRLGSVEESPVLPTYVHIT